MLSNGDIVIMGKKFSDADEAELYLEKILLEENVHTIIASFEPFIIDYFTEKFRDDLKRNPAASESYLKAISYFLEHKELLFEKLGRRFIAGEIAAMGIYSLAYKYMAPANYQQILNALPGELREEIIETLKNSDGENNANLTSSLQEVARIIKAV